MSFPLAITGCGMVSGIGLSAESSCAAIRCAIDNFQETRFMDDGGEWIIGSQVELEKPWRGETKLIKMAAMAIQECLDGIDVNAEKTPLLLCLSEHERAGRVIEEDNQFFMKLLEELNLKFHEKSRIIAMGQVSAAVALKRCRELFQKYSVPQILVVATDSYLVGSTLMDYQNKERLLTSNNSNGFIPGEAAAAILVENVNKESAGLSCQGIGFGMEEAHIESETPLRANGLSIAMKQALSEAQKEIQEMDFRIADISGEQYKFKESTLASGRLLRVRKKSFPIWHPADCVGETGAVIGVIMLILFKTASEKIYSDGPKVIVQMASDDGKRAALVVYWGDA